MSEVTSARQTFGVAYEPPATLQNLNLHPTIVKQLNVAIDWLTQRAEEAPTSFDPALPHRTALEIRMAWQALKRRASPGDELWAFVNPSSTWRKLGKCSGYAVVRDGEVVESIVTLRQ
jgi:hypothetical protein